MLVKKYWLIAAAISVGVVGISLLSGRVGGYVVDGDTVVSDVVKRGGFDVSVRGAGILTAKNTRWLAADVPGRVEQLNVEAGDVVEKDDVLVVLHNPQALEQLEEAKSQYDATEAETKAQIANLRTQLEEQTYLVREAELDYELALATYEAEEKLFESGMGAVSALAFKRSEVAVKRFDVRRKIQSSRLETMRSNIQAQEEALRTRERIMARALEYAKERVDRLHIKAAFDGVVHDLFLELGQELAVGDNIATLAQADNLVAELRIPEIQIQQVVVGQNVTVDTRTSKISGVVSRIDPAVNNGTVQVDVELLGELPREARPDLSVDGIINISNVEDSLYIKRPVHAQGNSRSELYRISKKNSIAERVIVEFGKASTDTIEVKSGLQVGDQVVVSETSNWGSHEIVNIN